MKTTITLISLSRILACLAASVQTQQRAAGGLAERFQQLDRNGGGKVRAEEFPTPQFKQMDKDGDGFLTLEETQAFCSWRQTPQPVPERPTTTASRRPAEPVNAVSSLTKPSLEICLSASSAEEATKFFADGIGLVARGEPRGGTSSVAMRMLLFTARNSTIKVRVYAQPPAKLPTEIAAHNGVRVLTIPVEKLNDVVARLKRLGFEVTDVK